MLPARTGGRPPLPRPTGPSTPRGGPTLTPGVPPLPPARASWKNRPYTLCQRCFGRGGGPTGARGEARQAIKRRHGRRRSALPEGGGAAAAAAAVTPLHSARSPRGGGAATAAPSSCGRAR